MKHSQNTDFKGMKDSKPKYDCQSMLNAANAPQEAMCKARERERNAVLAQYSNSKES